MDRLLDHNLNTRTSKIGIYVKILCASRNPTSPSRTSSCTKVAQDGAKLAPNWVQKSTQNGVPHRTWNGANMEANNLQTRAKMGPKHPNTNPKTSQNERQNRVPHRTVRWGTPLPCGKNRFKKATQQKKRPGVSQRPPFGAEKVANMAPS